MSGRRGLALLALTVAALALASMSSRAAAPVTVRLLDWRLGEEPAGAALTRLIETFAQAHPDVRVEAERVAVRDRVSRLLAEGRSGQPPDVVRVLTTDVPALQAADALLDLSPLVAGGAQAVAAEHSAFLVAAATSGGRLRGVPSEGDAFVLYVNTRLWREAGLDPDRPPRTLEELAKANRALTRGRRHAFAMLAEPTAAALWMQSWFLASGTDFFNPTYTNTLLDSPKAVEAFRFYTGMYLRDRVVTPEPTEVDYAAQINLFAQERVAYIQGPYATRASILAANPALAPVLRAIPFPGTGATAGRGTLYVVPRASRQPEAALTLIEWLVSEESQLRLFREAGMMPSRTSALGRIDVDADPVARVMIREAIPAARSYPLLAAWPKAKVAIDEAITSTLLGRAEPERALRSAARDVRAILAGR